MADLWQNDCFDGRFRHNGGLTQYKGYCTDTWFDLAKNYMGNVANKTNRTSCICRQCRPRPHWVPARYKKPYQGKGPAAFYGMMANIDENLGKLDDYLRDNGLWDNTIVVYFNDNGGTAGVPVFNAGMRGRKTQYYEGGHRASCFIRWPAGGLKKPCDIDTLTEVQDLLPTLIDLCGLEKPQTAKFDGASLAGLLKGAAAIIPERMLVLQYGQVPQKWDAAIMWNKWRLVFGNDPQTDPQRPMWHRT